MANKGRNTNTSQLYGSPDSGAHGFSFIIYRPVPHLDRKHTVFGKVVGGLEILDQLENIPTDHDEKPQQEIKINKLLIFVDPFEVLPLPSIL
jgi:peptidyl-prolyl cis-trans isomerase-like protein 2